MSGAVHGASDVVVCPMGLMFVPDPSAVLAQVRRVLAPLGVFSLGDASTLETLASDAGLVSVGVERHDLEFGADDIDAHLDRICELAEPSAMVLRAASADQFAAVRRTAADLAAAPSPTGASSSGDGPARLGPHARGSPLDLTGRRLGRRT